MYRGGRWNGAERQAARRGGRWKKGFLTGGGPLIGLTTNNRRSIKRQLVQAQRVALARWLPCAFGCVARRLMRSSMGGFRIPARWVWRPAVRPALRAAQTSEQGRLVVRFLPFLQRPLPCSAAVLVCRACRGRALAASSAFHPSDPVALAVLARIPRILLQVCKGILKRHLALMLGHPFPLGRLMQ